MKKIVKTIRNIEGITMMKLINTVAVVITMALFACAPTPTLLPPKTVAVDVSGSIFGQVHSIAEFIYKKRIEYPQLSEKQLNVVVIEGLLRESKEVGLIDRPEDAHYFRKLYISYFSSGDQPTSAIEVEKKVSAYVKDNPLPITKRIIVDAVENASRNQETGWMSGVEVKLPEGKWQIKPIGGGWSAWSADSQKPPKVKGAWTWNVYIKRPNTESVAFGETGSWWEYKTSAAALDSVRQQTYPFSLSSPNSVYFWIFDNGDTANNRGYVELELTRIP
ncbi:MAG: hypothetical protein EPN22_12505 [Nitrospirae bacterium]|nr:MAG: hypothetical protein EPN22_12505 [Nitrospirota bacterium]